MGKLVVCIASISATLGVSIESKRDTLLARAEGVITFWANGLSSNAKASALACEQGAVMLGLS